MYRGGLKGYLCNLHMVWTSAVDRSTLLIHVITCWVLHRRYTEQCVTCSNQTQTAPAFQNADSSPSKHRTWPDVVSMLVQRRWRWANVETTLSNPCVCWAPHRRLSTPTPPPPKYLPANHGTFSRTVGWSKLTTILEIESQPSANFTMRQRSG